MKKIYFLLLFITTILATSCNSSEDEPKVDSNPMVNTVWASSYGDYVLWIEFTSNSDFLNYMGDMNGNTNTTGVNYGKYKYSNGRIDFTKHDDTNTYDYAIVKGSVLTLYYKSGYSRTYKKKN